MSKIKSTEDQLADILGTGCGPLIEAIIGEFHERLYVSPAARRQLRKQEAQSLTDGLNSIIEMGSNKDSLLLELQLREFSTPQAFRTLTRMTFDGEKAASQLLFKTIRKEIRENRKLNSDRKNQRSRSRT